MNVVEVEEVVAALNERGFIANVHRPGLNRVCVRIVLPGGAEALWDTDGAAGLEAQVMADGMLVGFVPTIPGSAHFDVAQTIDAIATAKYVGGILVTVPEDEPAAALVMGQLKAVDTREAASALDKRKTFLGAIVTLVVLVIIFVGLIPKFASYEDAWAEIQGMAPAALAAIGVSVLVMLVVYVLPYQAAIPGMPYKPAFVIRQTSFMISNTIPAGGAFGLAIQFAMLSSYSVSVAAATAGIAVTSLWSLFMTLTLPVFGVLAALTTGQLESQWVWVALAGIAATVASIVVLWLILRSESSARTVGDLGNRLLAPVNRRRAQPLDAVGMSIDLRTSTSDVVLGRWRWVTVSNYLVVLAQFSVLWFAIQGVLGDAPTTLTLAGAFAAFAISRMASMIPVTPGGLGTVDAALIALLTTFGLTNDEAVASTLVWRACSWVPQVSLGVLTFIYWRIAQARVGRAAAA